jgi:hypothetical protein
MLKTFAIALAGFVVLDGIWLAAACAAAVKALA